MQFEEGDAITLISGHFKRSPDFLTRITKGVMTLKFEFHFGNEAFILRIFPGDRKETYLHESGILKKAHALGCLVPNVKYTGIWNEKSYLIYSKLQGLTLSEVFPQYTPAEQQSIARQIVDNLLALSAIRYGFFGSIMRTEKTYPEWRSFLNATIRDGLELFIELLHPAPGVRSRLESFMDQGLLLAGSPERCLTWTDFSMDNIIVEGSRLQGFIDFEGCMAGDPLLSLGYLFAQQGSSVFFKTIKNEFCGSREIPDDLIVFYAFIRIFRIAKYMNEPLPAGHPREPLFSYFSGLNEMIGFVNNK